MQTLARTTPQRDFEGTLNGLLYSLLSWQQLSDFWPRIDISKGWYLYAIGEPLPSAPVDSTHVAAFIKKIDELLRRDHDEEYCGIVYADDLIHPNLIKIYDPHHLGSSCGSSKNPPLPGWVMSTMPPSELQPKGIVPANRKRWWQTFLSTAGS